MHKTKRQIRKEILRKLNSQAGEKALKKSNIIKEKLFSLPEFKKSKFVMLYASKSNEVDTKSIIDEALKMGKRVVLPRCTSQKGIVPKEIRNTHTDLEKGIY